MSELTTQLHEALSEWVRATADAYAAASKIVALAGDGVIAAFSDGSYVWVPEPLQCVAPTKKGTRCRNPVFGGQEFRPNENGTVSYPWEAEERIQRQLCSLHDDGGVTVGTESFVVLPTGGSPRSVR